MYGILTDDPDGVDRVDADVTYYLAERVNGERRDPVAGAVNSVACWGDTALVREDPSRAAVDDAGTRATPDADGHHWGTVCPADDAYRAGLLDRIETAGAVSDVRLTAIGFPGERFCRCERCEARFEASDHGTWTDWRTDAITGFVADAAARVEHEVVATLYPDPYPGSLQERAGIDPAALADHVDGLLVPLCDIDYGTTYWVESLARGFANETADLDAELTLQLSAADAGADRLVDLTRQIDPYADHVVFGTHRTDEARIERVLGRLRGAAVA